MIKCQLCSPDSSQPWNVPLLETANFAVLPSVGALVEGWTLIVPKAHFLSYATMPNQLIHEAEELKNNVSDQIQGIYGCVAAFEHGPSRENRSVGCGVDHAHLHVLPVCVDLARAVLPYLRSNPSWTDATFADCREAVDNGDDYLYFEQPIGRGRMLRGPELGSQLFRRAIAAVIGKPNEYNWREFPQLANVHNTIRILSGALNQSALSESECAA